MVTKTALITGASSGIGLELARLFAKNGFYLILVARSEERLEKLADELRYEYHVQVATFAKDLTHLNEIQSLFQIIEEENIFVDFLVNNAGFGDYGCFVESDWHKIHQMINLNMTSLTYMTHLFLQRMKKEGRGRIMNVASTAAFQPGPLMAVYFATKSYVLNFSEALFEELKEFNITVTTYCPGATATNFSNEANTNNSKLFKNRKLPTAANVAEYGFVAMMQGKRLAIYGFMNRLMVFGTRLTPRSIVLKMSKFILKE
jgi:short-subunit dehydrogenase